jgi:hypothetical protein
MVPHFTKGNSKLFSAHSASTMSRTARFQASRARVSAFLSDQRVESDGIAELWSTARSMPQQEPREDRGHQLPALLAPKKVNSSAAMPEIPARKFDTLVTTVLFDRRKFLATVAK